MNKSDLTSLRDKLSEYRRQFENNYDWESLGPYGSNKEKRSISKSKYENAVYLTDLLIRQTDIYNFLKDRGRGILERNWINKRTELHYFGEDLKKLLRALDDEIRLLP